MTKNIYQDLKDKNVLIEKLTLIEKLASNGVSEDRIADILGFSKRYFKKLKEKNKDFTEVHDRGRGNFKQSRIDNIIKVAKGGSYADSGLTGRKLQCDSYRTVFPHRGGALVVKIIPR